MRVVLARRRESAATPSNPPPVHAYRLPDDGRPVRHLRAACGHLLAPGEAEQVEEFTGAPCTPCLLLLVRDSNAVRSASTPELPPVREVADSGRFAVALRGERVTHLVGDGAVRGQYEGRDVVQTLCCFMAWGPLATSPDGWPVCDECTRIAGS